MPRSSRSNVAVLSDAASSYPTRAGAGAGRSRDRVGGTLADIACALRDLVDAGDPRSTLVAEVVVLLLVVALLRARTGIGTARLSGSRPDADAHHHENGQRDREEASFSHHPSP